MTLVWVLACSLSLAACVHAEDAQGRFSGDVEKARFSEHVSNTNYPEVFCGTRDFDVGGERRHFQDCADPNAFSEHQSDGRGEPTRLLDNFKANACPAGYFIADSSVCVDLWSYACDNVCYQCPSGSYSRAGEIDMRIKWLSPAKDHHCPYCPPGTTTEGPGKTSAADCTVRLVWMAEDVPGYGASWWDCNVLIAADIKARCLAIRDGTAAAPADLPRPAVNGKGALSSSSGIPHAVVSSACALAAAVAAAVAVL